MFRKLRENFKTKLFCYRKNIYGYFCPNCSLLMINPTAFAETIYDEKYHKNKIYIRCNECYTTTPAFEDFDKVEDNWNDLFINKEVELFGEGEGDE